MDVLSGLPNEVLMKIFVHLSSTDLQHVNSIKNTRLQKVTQYLLDTRKFLAKKELFHFSSGKILFILK